MSDRPAHNPAACRALSRWHQSSCYPEASSVELEIGVNAVVSSLWNRDMASAPRDGTLIFGKTDEATGTIRWGEIARRDTLNDDYSSGMAVAQFRSEYGWKSPNDKRINGKQPIAWMPIPALAEA